MTLVLDVPPWRSWQNGRVDRFSFRPVGCSVTALVGRLLGDGSHVCVELRGGVVAAVTPVAEAPARWLAPGLVDLQVNGYGGVDCNDGSLSVEGVRRLVEREWAAGVAAFCPTLVSGPEERICDALAAIAAARRSDPLIAAAIPAVHVEGPALSGEDGPRGAHDRAMLRPPDLRELARWQRAGAGGVGIVTLAPELPGAADYIRGASRQGLVVALGHSAAHPFDIVAAVDAGARLSTHLGNGCHQVIDRHANVFWTQLAEDRLLASFIADGHHLPVDALRAMLRAKGTARSLLVSDSVALAGSPPGRYTGVGVGGDVTVQPNGRLSLTGSDLLAGSASSLSQCLAWVIRVVGIVPARALAMASANPNRLLGRPAPVVLAPGVPANVTVFRREIGNSVVPEATYLAGSRVAGAAGPSALAKGRR